MRRRVLCVVASVAVLLCATSAGATTITLSDIFADNHIGLNVVTTSDTTNATVSANCAVAGVNLWNCTEGAPVVISADFVRSGSALGDANFNIWDDHAGGTISDTLSFAFTNITSTSAHGTITFQSGLGTTPFAPAGNTVNLVEGAPLVFDLSGARDGGTVTVDVPEPATFTLFAAAVASIGARRLRKQRQRS